MFSGNLQKSSVTEFLYSKLEASNYSLQPCLFFFLDFCKIPDITSVVENSVLQKALNSLLENSKESLRTYLKEDSTLVILLDGLRKF